MLRLTSAWVQVGTPRESSAPGSAHFCMSLVIDPPQNAFALELGGLRACWGTPLGLATNRGAGQRAAKVMWIVAIGKDGSGDSADGAIMSCAGWQLQLQESRWLKAADTGLPARAAGGGQNK